MRIISKKNKTVLEYAMLTLGTFIMAAGISMFYSPNGLVTGGVTGGAIVIETLTARLGRPVPIWLTNLSANIPLFLLGARVFGFKRMYKTAFATAMLTAWLYVTNSLPPFVTGEMILVSVFGGVFGGVGLGLVLRCMATTGGSDMAASLIHTLALPHVTISKIMFALDAVVIGLGFFVFGPEKAMYAIIAVFVSVKIIDAIQEGFSFAKAAFIISERPDDIARTVMAELRRGVTGLSGRGMYTKSDKNVLLCVVSSKEIVKIKSLVHQIDQNAFIIVADVREVLGEGFTETA